MAAWLAIVVLIASGCLIVGRHDAFAFAGLDAAEIAMTVSGALLMVCLAAALLPQIKEARPRLHRVLVRGAALAVIVGAGVLAAGPFQQQTGALLSRAQHALPLPAGLSDYVSQWRRSMTPAASTAHGEKAVRIRGRGDGHFYAAALVNGTPVAMMVDSGAGIILLKATDARDAGVDTSTLSYTTPVQTARGTMYAAPVRLRQLRVGVIGVDEIEALVAEPGKLETSLLGMNFLSRLRSYEFSGAFLTLRG